MEVTILWKEEGRQEGLRQGLEQGLERGLEQGLGRGKQEGMMTVILQLLAQQFGPIEQGARDQVSKLDAEQLGRLATSLREFKHVEDVTRRLRALRS